MQPINHYVPRFLLKNFCVGKKPRLWVFDKKTGSVFHAHIQKVAGERRFYDLEVGDTTVSIEEPLAQVEGKTSKIIRRVIEAKNLKVLTTADRATISLFVALQMLRVPHQREHLLAFDRVLRESLEEKGIDIEQVENYQPMTPESAKAVSILSMMQPQPFAEHILNKTWLLFETKPSVPFWISDNPITLQNLFDRGPRGNLGLAVPGIEIYLPISHTLTLAFYCRSHEQAIRAGVEKYKALVALKPELAQRDYRALFEMLKAMTDGTPLGSIPENVENHNSLQVRHAERFIYSSRPDFALATSMISDSERYKTGPRAEVAR